MQKQAVQAITNSDYQAHSTSLFSNQRILDIFQVNTFEIAKFMFYFKNNLFPPLLFNLFVMNSQIHNRVPEQPVIIKHICAVQISSNFTILYQGPKIWNSLPVSVTCLSNLL